MSSRPMSIWMSFSWCPRIRGTGIWAARSAAEEAAVEGLPPAPSRPSWRGSGARGSGGRDLGRVCAPNSGSLSMRVSVGSRKKARMEGMTCRGLSQIAMCPAPGTIFRWTFEKHSLTSCATVAAGFRESRSPQISSTGRPWRPASWNVLFSWNQGMRLQMARVALATPRLMYSCHTNLLQRLSIASSSISELSLLIDFSNRSRLYQQVQSSRGARGIRQHHVARRR
mmetsp:Transcript_63216/g.170529  ORF Transcript_63216/g.170529 Transcript_63216/m.170529 type:complete len:226 (+) Transcript_63216:161-838(+)